VEILNNAEIKTRAAGVGVRLWQIAERYGINDGNFSRKLRRELPEEEKQKIMAIIDQLAKEMKENA